MPATPHVARAAPSPPSRRAARLPPGARATPWGGTTPTSPRPRPPPSLKWAVRRHVGGGRHLCEGQRGRREGERAWTLPPPPEPASPPRLEVPRHGRARTQLGGPGPCSTTPGHKGLLWGAGSPFSPQLSGPQPGSIPLTLCSCCCVNPLQR